MPKTIHRLRLEKLVAEIEPNAAVKVRQRALEIRPVEAADFGNGLFKILPGVHHTAPFHHDRPM
jgi:hypothetical protein